MITNKRFPDQLLVGINNRNPACFDMYRCDVASGKLTLDTENPGDVLGWGTEDESFEVPRTACGGRCVWGQDAPAFSHNRLCYINTIARCIST